MAESRTPSDDRGSPVAEDLNNTKRPGRPRWAEIEFTASVHADKLSFGEPPETEVRFSGSPDHDSASGSDRTNLPEKVEPHITYRDVHIDYRLVSRIRPAGIHGPD